VTENVEVFETDEDDEYLKMLSAIGRSPDEDFLHLRA
jgi:hypothetical protein